MRTDRRSKDGPEKGERRIRRHAFFPHWMRQYRCAKGDQDMDQTDGVKLPILFSVRREADGLSATSLGV